MMQCISSQAGRLSVTSIPNHSRIPQRIGAHCVSQPANSKRHRESTSIVVCNAVANDALTSGPSRPGPPPYTPAPLGEYGERIIVGEFEDEDEDMNIKLECDESGCVIVVGKKLTTLMEDKSEGLLHCSLTGQFSLLSVHFSKQSTISSRWMDHGVQIMAEMQPDARLTRFTMAL